jgi:hypothetical protein
MPYNTFNVADWKLRETPAGLVLRPTLWHALAFRLFFGTGAMAIFLLGAGGLDYELSKMEQARRVTPEQLATLTRDEDPRIRIARAAGRTDEAERVRRDTDAQVAKFVADHENEYQAMAAAHRPWHGFLRTLAGIFIFFGLYLPLSPFWQRVRVTREGDDVVVRKNVLPKTRRISLRAVPDAFLQAVNERVMENGDWQTVSTYWQLVLPLGESSLVLYLAVGSSDAPPPRATAFLAALDRLAGVQRPA